MASVPWMLAPAVASNVLLVARLLVMAKDRQEL